MTFPKTLDIVGLAHAESKNLIITHELGRGVVKMTRESVLNTTGKAIVADSIRLELWDLQAFDDEAEIVVLTDFDKARPEVKAAIRSWLTKTPAGDVAELPNLKSVIILQCCDDEDDLVSDTDAVAQELGRLAPSIVLRIAG
ncbi:hypothetical protein [Arthrobacter koreensis]|uniref:hypothetical protein n=1 Tax=Arthrobacter koreensis TaxID=199136 RepID=UPI00380BC39E